MWCVFITAVPITKLFACVWGEEVEDMCYERRRAEASVDTSGYYCSVCLYYCSTYYKDLLTCSKLFACVGGETMEDMYLCVFIIPLCVFISAVPIQSCAGGNNGGP